MKRTILIIVVLAVACLMWANSRAYPAVRHDATGRYEWIALSTDTKPDANMPGSTLYETDTGNMYIANGTRWMMAVNKKTATPDTLTSETNTTVYSTAGFEEITYIVDFSSIDSSADSLVIFYVEGRSETSGWVNLDADADSLVQTDDGTVGIRYEGAASIDSVRANVSAGSTGYFQGIFSLVRGGSK